MYEPQKSNVLVSNVCLCACIIRYLIQLLRRKVRSICDRSKVRNKWSINMTDDIPVDAVEERMPLDLFHVQPFV